MGKWADIPSGDLATSATLRRGFAARLRTLRVHEILAWVVIVAAGLGALHASAGERFWLLLVGGAGVAIRLAIATESVRFDETGVTWRSLFVTYHLEWHEITLIEVAARTSRLRFFNGRQTVTTFGLVIGRGPGLRSLYVTPSVWVPLVRQGEFLAAARLASPNEWHVPDDDSSGHHHGSGKRVGRPTRRPRD